MFKYSVNHNSIKFNSPKNNSTLQLRSGQQKFASQRCRRIKLTTQAGRDFYNVLGVGKSADKKEIKSAYRQKARKFHPDVNKAPDAADKFKEISEAYEVLQDDQKRQIYDTYGEEGLKGGLGGMGGMGGAGFSDPFEIFEAFFGGRGFGGMGGFGGAPGGMSQQPQRGENEEYDIVIDFMEAVFGCKKEIETSRLITCETCSGSGIKEGTQKTCQTCRGQGRMAQRMSTPLGELQQITTCPACKGTGEISDPCRTCGGDGRVRSKKKVEVDIPAGIDNGNRLRLAGEGSAGRRGGPPGDMFVLVKVSKHPELERQKENIHCTVEISYLDAILGTSVTIQTVDGNVEMRIPEGTQPGTVLKMGGRGVPYLGQRNKRGDQLVHIVVKIPTSTSQQEREKMEELRQMSKTARKSPFGAFKG